MLNAEKRRGFRTGVPALRLVSPDYSFDPEALAALCAAYDRTIATLGANQSKAVRETVAKRIIEAGARGQRDPGRLCCAALRRT